MAADRMRVADARLRAFGGNAIGLMDAERGVLLLLLGVVRLLRRLIVAAGAGGCGCDRCTGCWHIMLGIVHFVIGLLWNAIRTESALSFQIVIARR